MITLNQLTDQGLLHIYANSCRILARKKKQPQALPELTLESLQLDQDYVMREINRRTPTSHLWEIDKIKMDLHKTQHIAGGQWYRHLKVGIITLQVIDEDYTGQYNCRCYIKGMYINRFLVKQSTLLEHYQKI